MPTGKPNLDTPYKRLLAQRVKRKPNRQSIGIHPRNALQKTKAEMQADLKKAVENTK